MTGLQMRAGYLCLLRLTSLLAIGSLTGCQFDSPSGSHLIWADRNTVGQPSVLLESVRRDIYRQSPPKHVVPDQQLQHVHADSLLFGESSSSREQGSESWVEAYPVPAEDRELPPPRSALPVQPPESSASIKGSSEPGSPSLPSMKPPTANLPSLLSPNPVSPDPSLLDSSPPSPLQPGTARPDATSPDPARPRPPAPSLPQNQPTELPVSPNRPLRGPDSGPSDDVLHQAVFLTPPPERGPAQRPTRNPAPNGDAMRRPGYRKPAGAWLFSN